MLLTENIGLKKPGYNDEADVAVINENMDVIDAELSNRYPKNQTYSNRETDEAIANAINALPSVYSKGEIDAMHEAIKADILYLRDLIKLILGTSYIATTNGTYTTQAITTHENGTTSRIRTDEIAVKAGDVIEITNGSLYHMCAIWKDSISASNVIRNDSSIIYEDERIVIENDGVMVVVFRNKSNTALSPDDFDGSVTLYRKATVYDELATAVQEGANSV